jgi:hypothetical protein
LRCCTGRQRGIHHDDGDVVLLHRLLHHLHLALAEQRGGARVRSVDAVWTMATPMEAVQPGRLTKPRLGRAICAAVAARAVTLMRKDDGGAVGRAFACPGAGPSPRAAQPGFTSAASA